MILYLIDSSAPWRVVREDSLRSAWSDVISAGASDRATPNASNSVALPGISMNTNKWVHCSTTCFRGLVVLHDDKDYATAAHHLTDIAERRVHHVPPQD